MTDVARLVTEAHRAHKAGRKLAERKMPVEAREQFRLALDARLSARELDPTYQDPAWLEDVKNLHAGIRWAGTVSAALHKQFDLDIERYLRQQVGEVVNSTFQVDLKSPGAVKAPDAWRVVKAGRETCQTCHHPLHDQACTVQVFAEFAPGQVQACGCADPVKLLCRHVWAKASEDRRTCVACGEQQALQPVVPVERTRAFEQAQAETKNKS